MFKNVNLNFEKQMELIQPLNKPDQQEYIQPINYDPIGHIIPAGNEEKPCSTCSGKGPSASVQYVYAIGKIQVRFPSVSIEKEFIHASRGEGKPLTDSENIYQVLKNPINRYIARKLCWTLTIGGIETYFLQAIHPTDVEMLIESLNPTPKLGDIDVLIGLLGPIAPSHYCNGMQLPILIFDQIYSFDVDSLIRSIEVPNDISAEDFYRVAEELFLRLLQMTDNSGATDQYRAINFVAVRYPNLYYKTAELNIKNFSLTAIDFKQSRLSGARNILELVFTYNSRADDTMEKFSCRIDVTDEFPFLVTKLQSYFDH